ncbi:MAG: hypothetical protein ACT4N2_09990 [Hyphomicrobium sp.]
MKEAEFHGLVAQLGGSSEVQRKALIEALGTKRPQAEATDQDMADGEGLEDGDIMK